MPVAIWSMNRASVALPKTYHQLAVERGTRWARMGWTTAPIPARSSIHRLTLRSVVGEPRHAELHTGPDSVGSWPPRTQSWPSRTWYSYS